MARYCLNGISKMTTISIRMKTGGDKLESGALVGTVMEGTCVVVVEVVLVVLVDVGAIEGMLEEGDGS